MENLYRRSLVCFRRDLRIHDNTALDEALRVSEAVLPCFVFDPAQTQPHPYRSVNGLAFLIESLEELSETIEAEKGALLVTSGKPGTALERIVESANIEAVFVNTDYTPYSRSRDDAIRAMCARRGVAFHSAADALLADPLRFGKPDGSPYTVFTPFFKRASRDAVPRPKTSSFRWLPIPEDVPAVSPRDFMPLERAREREIVGGRSRASSILSGLERYRDYGSIRDVPALNGTTRLSAHLKFGTVSVREVYWSIVDSLGRESPLLRELYWRDFFTHIAWHFPRVFSGAFHEEYDELEWSDDPDALSAWKRGATGFPIVDAGMRELVQSGFMHNRVRMIAASFLVKDLHVSWRRGEEHFAQYLVDYDPSVNNGNWQWAASTGCDAQPYFRIFNPWIQQKRFDPECSYIKRWVPELAGLSPKEIHDPEGQRPSGYPSPIVDHAEEKAAAEEMFETVRERRPKKRRDSMRRAGSSRDPRL